MTYFEYLRSHFTCRLLRMATGTDVQSRQRRASGFHYVCHGMELNQGWENDGCWIYTCSSCQTFFEEGLYL